LTHLKGISSIPVVCSFKKEFKDLHSSGINLLTFPWGESTGMELRSHENGIKKGLKIRD